MAQGWFFCPLVIFYALATHTLVLDPAASWGSLAGAFIFIGFYYFIRSLVAGSVSTNASIFRLNFIVTVFLVVALLGEPLTPSKIAGLALALLATWLLVGAGVTADRTPNEHRALHIASHGARINHVLTGIAVEVDPGEPRWTKERHGRLGRWPSTVSNELRKRLPRESRMGLQGVEKKRARQ